MLINDHRFKDYKDFATSKENYFTDMFFISLIITMQSHPCNQLFAVLFIV